ncbi:MAG: carboxypeptidase regulatory-like domain-containing protein [Vulcanimicrobiaceae bacterium]
MRRALRSVLPLALILALVSGLVGPVLGGTVGLISGQVTDAQTRAPLANVRVTAISPSGRGRATTDSRGFYSVLGLAPDTYTVSFERSGYEPRAVEGQTVNADQTTTVGLAMEKALRTIANVGARASSSAFQPNHPHDTYTVTAKDIGEIQGTQLNNNATQLFTSLPSVTSAGQVGGVPIVRAGRANEIGISVNGAPETNSFTGTFGAAQLQDQHFNFDVLDTVPTLAIQDLQLTPGVADASFGDTGTGNINIVFKKGAYPAFSDAILGLGGGHYYHGVSLDYGAASPDGRWNAYFMYHGDNKYPNWGDGHTATEAGVLYWPGLQVSRQYIGNVGYNWGPNNKYGVQLQAYADYAALAADYGANNAQVCFYTCNQNTLAPLGQGDGMCSYLHLDDPVGNNPPDAISGYPDQKNCWGLLPLYPGQRSYSESVAQAGLAAFSEDFPHYNYQVEFHANLTPTTFMQARFFRSGGYQTDNQLDVGNPYIFQKGGPATGLNLDFTKQFSEKNLVKFGGSFSYVHPENNLAFPLWGIEITRFDNEWNWLDFVPQNYGNQGCPMTWRYYPLINISSTADYCGYLEQQTGSSIVQMPGNAVQTNISPHYASGYITDQWKPNSRLTANIGVRIDTASYNYPAPVVDPATCTSLYMPLTVTWPTDANGNPISVVPGKTCPKETFADFSDSMHPKVWQPRLGVAWKMGDSDAIRADYGRSMTWVPENFIDGGTVAPNVAASLARVPSYFNPGSYCLNWGSDVDPRCSQNGGTNPEGTPYPGFNQSFQPGQSVGYYNYYNPFPCGGGLVNGACPTNPNWPLPPPGQPNPVGAAACGIAPGIVPCTSYQQQLRWEYSNDYQGVGGSRSGLLQPIPPAQFSNYSFGYTHQFANGIGRGFLQSLTQGTGVALTVWKRNGGHLQVQQNLPQLNTLGELVRGPDNSILTYSSSQTANGVDLANGLEARITRSRLFGLSMQFSATYQHALTSVFADPNNVYSGLYGGSVNGPSQFLNLLYPVSYISPLTTSTVLSFHTRSGWRFGTRVDWSKGYPIGAGEYAAAFVSGNPYLVRNTNALNGSNATRFVDPFNPGTQLSPNIAATNGAAEGRYAWGKLTPPQSFTSAQIEKEFSNRVTIGLNVDNIFNEPWFGAQLNSRYQPVATGISGPKSGTSTNNLPAGVNYTQLLGGQGPFINVPSYEGRTYYLYLQIRNI